MWLTSPLLFVSTLLGLTGVALADNPIVQDIYTADPAPMVYNGRVYLFTGHDNDGSTDFNMTDWRLFSSADMVNWQHHGAYLYWGNPGLYYIKLNQDMLSYSGSINKVSLTTAGFGSRPNNAQRLTTFEEGPWLYKRGNLYYMIYAANCCSEDIRYSTGPSATGPWTYRGVVMNKEGRSFTNHPGIIDFENNSYFFYHNGALTDGSGYTRFVAVESFKYGSNGLIPEIKMTTQGPAQVKSLNPYVKQEAETIAWSEGIETEVKGVDFGGTGAKIFSARVASNSSGGKIELRLGSKTGKLVGTCTVTTTGNWQTYKTVDCPVSGATGTSDLFLVFTGTGSDYLFNFNWWQFS
ncbi:endo-1 4-beta-xylanase [Fusarium phyllophilum]|uniref:Endo-1 4-beta-xylanase n=1 Tax=Fusarium phyllophilum TaxID=47803 RepID=A0A8H5IMK0_9HYPO|nr:endo-1 4-beta-xylanase [Fusarium phyllophilum]